MCALIWWGREENEWLLIFFTINATNLYDEIHYNVTNQSLYLSCEMHYNCCSNLTSVTMLTFYRYNVYGRPKDAVVDAQAISQMCASSQQMTRWSRFH